MPCHVRLSEDAERDIAELYHHNARQHGHARAEALLEALERCCHSLADHAARGNVPKELLELGIAEYRELHHQSYRIIYRLISTQVIAYCVADGRRDMQSLLLRRLTR